MSQTDAELVQAVLGGDRESFAELYDRYARLIRVICLDTTRDINQAQDLAQEVFFRAYSKLDRLENAERFGAWLVTMTRFVCREFRRGKYRDRHILVGVEASEFDSHEPIEHPQEDLSEELQQALSLLPEKERLALHVYYLQDKNVEQAMAILDVSRSGLYRLLEKARKKVEKYLKEAQNR